MESSIVEVAHPFLTGGGEMAELIAAFDWRATPLGPIATWPESRKAALAMVLRSPVPIVTLWGDSGVMIYNDGYARFAGTRHPTLLGSNVLEGWPEVADFNAHVMQAVYREGGALSYKDRELVLDRRGRPEQGWMDLDYSPLLDEAGRTAGVIAIVVETTEKVRAERWLVGEQDRLRRMFEQAPGFMAVLGGPEHVFELVNPSYQALIGDREVTGLTIREALPELAGQGFYELLDATYASGVPYGGAATAVDLQRTSDAPTERRFVDFVYQPLRDEAGKVVGIFVQGADVTDRILAEAEFRDSEARLRRAQEAGGVGVFTVDIETNLLSGTPQFWRIFGLPEQAAVDAAELERLVHHEDVGLASDAARRGAGQAVAQVEYRIRRGDTGEVRAIARQADFERDADGRPLRMVGVVQDVTDRRAVQQALEASEAQFRTFVQALPNQAWTAGADGTRLWSNERAAAYSGMSTEELRLNGWSEMVHPDDRAPTDARWRAALASGETYEAEMRLRRADGEYRWHLARALPIRDADGVITRWVGANTDIHEQKRAEVENQRDRDRMWTMSQDLMLVIDMEGVITSANPSVTRVLGWRQHEAVGRNVFDLLHPDDRRSSAAQMERIRDGSPMPSHENRFLTKNGDYRLLDWSAVPDGGRIHAVGRDITQERVLARNQERIWNLSPVLKLVGDVSGRIESVNPAWTEALGWSREASSGRSLLDFVAPENREAASARLDQLRAGRSVEDEQLAFVSEDGARRQIAWTFVPEAGRVYGFGRDVTEQRIAEDALRQSQKMEAVGQLTGGIAHDFNNLLQGITGSLDLVQKRIAQGRLGELDRFVAGAMTSASRAAALTHRLLAFSRRQPLDPRPVRANPLVASMDDLLRRTLGEHIELELVMAGGLWLTQCDPNQLESAILNLAINARDAMPSGGKLTIETCNAHLDSLYAATTRDVRPGQYVCICVTDTGSGMTPEVSARAFEPFFTTKPLGQGTGLGLSMIYGFAQQSEGYAKIYSEVGLGTTIKLYLPRHRGEEDEIDEPAMQLGTPHADGETVLVVEDEPVVRGLIIEVLSDLGYRSLEAADGPSGLAILQSRRRIDLLITDVGLPGLNGRQVADAGREKRPDLKVLFMTGYAENAAMASGFLEPGMAMITKPFAMEALAMRVRQIIEAE